MILSVTAVNEPFIGMCHDSIGRFDTGDWDIYIQTNRPEFFRGYKVVPYNNTIFSYFDKLLFPLKLSLQMKQGVLNIDADDLHKPSDELVYDFQNRKEEGKVLYPSVWPVDYGINDIDRLNYIRAYWDKMGFNYEELTLMWEWMLYIPYRENLLEIIYDIEYIKPAFEYGSLMSEHYNGRAPFGSEEGIALAYSLRKNAVEYETFKPCYLL